MSLSIDTSSQFVWAMANTEANFAHDDRIRPVHFFLGILKFCDVRFPSQIKNVDLSDEERQFLVELGAQTRHYLEMRPEEVTKLRRSMRSQIRTESAPPPHELSMLHRSDEARKVFSIAASKAVATNSTRLNALHILEALFESGEVSADGLHKPSQRPDSKGARWRIANDRDKNNSANHHEWPGRNLSHLAQEMKLAPFVGREKELKSLTSVFSRTNNRNALIVGEPGVGKTALVEGFALTLSGGGVPRTLKKMQILEIGGAQIAATCASAAELETRLLEAIHLATQAENAILFIDDLYGLVPKHLDLVSPLMVLISGLAETGMPCIAATTPTHHEYLTKLSTSFCRRFEPIMLTPTKTSDTRRIAEVWMARIAESQKVMFQTGVLDEAIRLVDCIPPGRVMPDRLINLLDNLATFARVTSFAATGSSKQCPEITPAQVRSILLEHYGVTPTAIPEET
jgi:ATP-dependent Clp protease ATP-binding subunit ClpC